MEALDYWKLCERITIFQAVMLIIGLDPESMESREVERNAHGNERNHNIPDGYGAVKTALLSAVRDGLLEAKVRELHEYDQNGNDNGAIPDTIDIDQTFVGVGAVREYLREREFESEFFSTFPDFSVADYLDHDNQYFAPKLAAAVEAWTAVTREGRFETESTPKQLMEKWLRENAVRFSLNKADGKLNEDAIAQITKIANWRPEGGASKSPGSKNPTTRKK